MRLKAGHTDQQISPTLVSRPLTVIGLCSFRRLLKTLETEHMTVILSKFQERYVVAAITEMEWKFHLHVAFLIQELHAVAVK